MQMQMTVGLGVVSEIYMGKTPWEAGGEHGLQVYFADSETLQTAITGVLQARDKLGILMADVTVAVSVSRFQVENKAIHVPWVRADISIPMAGPGHYETDYRHRVARGENISAQEIAFELITGIADEVRRICERRDEVSYGVARIEKLAAATRNISK